MLTESYCIRKRLQTDMLVSVQIVYPIIKVRMVAGMMVCSVT